MVDQELAGPKSPAIPVNLIDLSLATKKLPPRFELRFSLESATPRIAPMRGVVLFMTCCCGMNGAWSSAVFDGISQQTINLITSNALDLRNSHKFVVLC